MAGNRRQKQRDGAIVAVFWGERGGTVAIGRKKGSTTETTTAQVGYLRALANSEQMRRNRVAGANETCYNCTLGFDLVSIEDNADGSTGALTMTNVVVAPTAQVSATLGDIAGTNPVSGTARFYATDHLDSTRSAWDGSKASTGTYEFPPLRHGIQPHRRCVGFPRGRLHRQALGRHRATLPLPLPPIQSRKSAVDDAGSAGHD